MSTKLYRQGDVLIKRIKAVPQNTAKKRETGILAYGEVTGHCHKVETSAQAEVLEIGSDLYLRVSEDGVRIIHDEHAPITLPAGDYEVTIQREYSPEAAHRCTLCGRFGHYLSSCPDQISNPWPTPVLRVVKQVSWQACLFWAFMGFSAGVALAGLLMGWR